jgi:dienelactone hydrolase
MKPTRILIAAAVVISFTACNNNSSSSNGTSGSSNNAAPLLKEENVTYNGDNATMKGYIVYDENKKGTRPAVLVVHEWWGQNDYPRMRARELAKLGYVAMAVDIYGDGKTVETPEEANKMASVFYMNPPKEKIRFDAALNALKQMSQVDTNNIAAIGYCFGGGLVVNMAKMGEPLKGVVSFHGNLAGVPVDKNLLKSQILVCHGEDDTFVSEAEINQFKKQMDSIGASYEFRQYPNATHAFTNPEATAKGQKYNLPIAYNGAADTASWNDMKTFFGRIFNK